MNGNRFKNRLNKSNIKFNTLNPVYDNEKETALNVFEIIDELNYLNDCCDNLIDDNTEYVAEINQMHKENEQLKQSVNNLKDTIIKITIAYQRKYDRTIVDLVDEVHDEDITDLIKELEND